MKESRIIADYDHWPLAVWRFDDDNYTDDEVMRWLTEDVGKALQRNEPFGVIQDMKETLSTISQRSMAAKFVKENREPFQNLLAAAYVVDSRAVRGIITAIFWMVPPPYPYKVFAKVGDAIDWVSAQLKKAGITPPKLEPWR